MTIAYLLKRSYDDDDDNDDDDDDDDDNDDDNDNDNNLFVPLEIIYIQIMTI